MKDLKSYTVFSKIPPNPTKNESADTENSKISDWLEKLHIQGEKTRIDNNRREQQANSDKENQVNNNGQDLDMLGINVHTRNAATKREADRVMINDLVKKSNRRIISTSSAFPWSFFPDVIHVEESRVTFKFNQALSFQSHSVEIKDISNVFIESSILHATLQIVSRTYIQNDIKIRHLNKKKAEQVRKVIEGLRTFSINNINTSNYEVDELLSRIGEFQTTS